MYNSEKLFEKWAPVLEHADLPKITDPYKKAVTARLLENQEKACREINNEGLLNEEIVNQVGAGVSYSGNSNLKGYDPVLIALIRRLAPNLIAFDLCGVQPMSSPVALIFAMKSKYTNQGNGEALFNEANTAFTGTGAQSEPLNPNDPALSVGRPLSAAVGEQLGNPTAIPEMAFSIDRISVTAKTRVLKAEFTVELQQDLKAIHGLDAEAELANILSTEINAEINRELIRTIYLCAVAGAQHNTTVPGTFDLDVDSNGRWMVEKFKGLMYQVERDANQIAKETRRGKGNVLLTSSDVASALSMAGLLDYGDHLKDNLNVDDTGNTFVGRLNGRMDVYIDPYVATSNTNFYVVGYKGKSAYDAGIFYCPYIPLQLVKALDPNTFQPKIGFRTRYGLVANPFSNVAGNSTGELTQGTNIFYRRVSVTNLV